MRVWFQLCAVTLAGALAWPAAIESQSLRPAPPQKVVAQEVDLNIQLEPVDRIVFGKAVILLRNFAATEVDAILLRFPPPLGAAVEVRSTWDREDSLPWRRLRREEQEGEFLLQIPLERWLKPDERIRLGISFEIYMDRIAPGADALTFSSEEVRLRGLGWYPLPPASEDSLVGQLELTVRLPKTWTVGTPYPARKQREGLLLSTYEVEWKRRYPDKTELDMVLFEARAPQPARPPE